MMLWLRVVLMSDAANMHDLTDNLQTKPLLKRLDSDFKFKNNSIIALLLIKPKLCYLEASKNPSREIDQDFNRREEKISAKLDLSSWVLSSVQEICGHYEIIITKWNKLLDINLMKKGPAIASTDKWLRSDAEEQ